MRGNPWLITFLSLIIVIFSSGCIQKNTAESASLDFYTPETLQTQEEIIPPLTVADITVLEGDEAEFILSIPSPYYRDITVEYHAISQTASQGADFGYVAGTASLPKGTTEATIRISVFADVIPEGDEEFHLILSNGRSCEITNDTAVCVIKDDDVPQLTLTGKTVMEGDTGPVSIAVCTVTLSELPQPGYPVSFTWETERGTAYIYQDNGDVRETEGEIIIDHTSGLTHDIKVDIFGDDVGETDENFYIVISEITYASVISKKVECWIQNDDSIVRVSPDGDGTDGLTWATAFTHPRDALTAISGKGEVWVKAGEYFRKNSEEPVVYLSYSGAVYGGFEGTESSRDDRNFRENETVFNGSNTPGYVVNLYGAPILDGVTVTGGTGKRGVTFSDETEGGGIRADGGIIRNCIIKDNRGEICRGGLFGFGDMFIRISNCQFIRNQALHSIWEGKPEARWEWYQGGGASLYNGTFSIENSLFLENEGGKGAGVFLNSYQSMDIQISNCTFWGNVSHLRLGSSVGIECSDYGWESSLLKIRNSIFRKGVSEGRREIYISGLIEIAIEYCNIEGGYTGTGNIDLPVSFSDPENGDFSLNPGSPCIDAGINCTENPLDILGNPRHDDPGTPDTGLGFPPVDMGAYEFQGETLFRLTDNLSGSIVSPGDTVQISWDGTEPEYVNLYTSSDNGETWNLISEQVALSDGGFPWTVTNGSRGGTSIRVTCWDTGEVLDESGIFYVSSSLIWYVDCSLPASGDGRSWSSAFVTLGEAAEHAVYGDNVRVAEGIYSSDECVPVLVMPAGVSFFGGYTAGGSDVADPESFSTKIRGNMGRCVIGADQALLNGFQIDDGGTPGYSMDFGGGVLNTNTRDFKIYNCVFSRSTADGREGLSVYNGNAMDFEIRNCVFPVRIPYASDVFNENSTGIIEDCVFKHEESDSGGGAILNDSCGKNLLISRCVFWGDEYLSGSALRNRNWTTCVIKDSVFRYCGTGIENSLYSEPEIINCLFSDNTYAINNKGSSPRIYHATITNNGNGVYSTDHTSGNGSVSSYPVIKNSIIYDNGDSWYRREIIGNAIVSWSNILEGFPGEGNINAFPNFIDPESGDYRIGQFSPCIDAAHPDVTPETDLAGIPRIYAEDTEGCPLRFGDIGAYEYTGKNSIRLESPNGDEYYETGNFLLIEWISSEYGNVRIELSRDRGATWKVITDSVSACAGQYLWKVDGKGTDGAFIRLTLKGTGLFDQSDRAFFIESSRTWYVDPDAQGRNSGCSWYDAFTSLQECLRHAGNGDTVYVAEGVYTAENEEDSVIIALPFGVSLYGGCSAGGSVRDRFRYPSVIDGEHGDIAGVRGASEVIFDGFEIRNCSMRKGGMHNRNLWGVQIKNCSFIDNWGYRGGGMSNVNSLVSIKNCHFEGNECSFSCTGGVGSGMSNEGGYVEVLNCSFVKNQGEGYGGGIYNLNCDSLIVNCVFFDNYAGHGSSGGGICNMESSPDIINCTFALNGAASGGQNLANLRASHARIFNCIFAHGQRYIDSLPEYAEFDNIYNGVWYYGAPGPDGTATFSNCLIKGLDSLSEFPGIDGGGNFDGDPEFVNAPIVSYLQWRYSEDPVDSFSDYYGLFEVGDIIEIGGDGVLRTVVSLDDPYSSSVTFSPARDNWLDDFSVYVWEENGGDTEVDLRLKSNSPCIDRGDTGAVPSGITNDIDGNPRFNGQVDIGAYENQNSQLFNVWPLFGKTESNSTPETLSYPKIPSSKHEEHTEDCPYKIELSFTRL